MTVEMTSARHLDSDSRHNNAYDNTAFVDEEARIGGQENGDEPYSGGDNDDCNCYNRWLRSTQEQVTGFYTKYKKTIVTAIMTMLIVLYFAYFALAMWYKFGDEGSLRLLGLTVFGVFCLVIKKLKSAYTTEISENWNRTKSFRESRINCIVASFIKWLLRVGIFIALTVYVIIDIAIDMPENLICISGLAIYVLIFYVTSTNPAKVKWHTVYLGIAMQYIFALMILRTQWGFSIFKWLGDRVTEFLEYTTIGSKFVFGEDYVAHFFAMKVMVTVVFFFSFINILYYLGAMQAIINVIGRFLSFCMGTTAAESINAASNIFISMQESALIIRPFLNDMTRSELHAVMTGGFATIAGSVLGAYISFGVPANHLLSASVMSAPAALAISKLSYPETEKSKASSKDFSKLEAASDKNILEAAMNGATASIKVVGAIIVNVMAFLCLLGFLNATLTWLGDRVGIEDFTFEFISSYVLYPVSFFMGVESDDCRKVSVLIGVKMFTNEFVAYGQLKELITSRHALNNYTEFYNTTAWYRVGDNVMLNITGEVLIGGIITEKSEVIATYALCGFANFGAIGSNLGCLSVLAPNRKSDMSKIVLRAMICGNIACFTTACIAGMLYKPL